MNKLLFEIQGMQLSLYQTGTDEFALTHGRITERGMRRHEAAQAIGEAILQNVPVEGGARVSDYELSSGWWAPRYVENCKDAPRFFTTSLHDQAA